MQIRPAKVSDVPSFSQIINDAADFGLMLHRSLEYLYEHVRDFHAAVVDDQVVGCCGLRVVWADYAEVFALAVAKSQRGQGIGRKLVQACVDEAISLGIPRLMTLTYERKFFEYLGFVELNRQALPLKVWSECVRCAKNQACDEIAMVRVLHEVPQPVAPNPPGEPDRYQVPVVLKVRGQTPATVSGEREPMDEAPQ